MKRAIIGAALWLLGAGAAVAQEAALVGVCQAPEVQLLDATAECLLAAQAVESAQPQLGILIAGGNPLIGTASAGGLRLGLVPNVNASVRANVVFARVPDLLAQRLGGGARELNDAVGIPVPALSGNVGVAVLPGLSVAPTLGGIGAVTLLGSASWLPLRALDVQGFGRDAPEFAYGVGARVGLLRESFTVPGVSASVMYHGLGRVGFGDVCDAASTVPLPTTPAGGGPQREIAGCLGPGDVGEFAFDLTSWSGQLTVGKRLLGFGVTAGAGYNHFQSEIDFGFRAPRSLAGTQVTPVFTASGLDVTNGRWSGFVDLSYTLLVGTIGLEAGWLSGGEALPGFGAVQTDFDPGQGTWFGGLGVRLAL